VNINQIRRSMLTLWLRGVRLPLTIAETVVRRGHHKDAWPPALAFAQFEGAVKDTVGRVTRDDTLIELAALQRAEVAERRRAIALEAEAASTTAAVREDMEAEKARLAKRRAESDRRSREQEARVEADRQEAKRALEQRSARRRSAANASAASKAKVIDRAATGADATRLRKNAQALRAKERAVAAQGTVLALDKAVRAKKATRRTG
jgi:hypothetical protein